MRELDVNGLVEDLAKLPWICVVSFIAACSCEGQEARDDADAEKAPSVNVTGFDPELESLSAEQIWMLGVERFGWDPDGFSEDESRSEIVARFVQDKRIEHYNDKLEAPEDLGYIE